MAIAWSGASSSGFLCSKLVLSQGGSDGQGHRWAGQVSALRANSFPLSGHQKQSGSRTLEGRGQVKREGRAIRILGEQCDSPRWVRRA